MTTATRKKSKYIKYETDIEFDVPPDKAEVTGFGPQLSDDKEYIDRHL